MSIQYETVVKLKVCPVTISIKVAAQDKQAMVDAYRATHASDKPESELPDPAELVLGEPDLTDEEATKLPPLQYDKDDRSDWITFDQPLHYMYAGQGPYVGRYVDICVLETVFETNYPLSGQRDLMQFPVSEAGDGLIDVVIQEAVSFLVSPTAEIWAYFVQSNRGAMLKAIGGAPQGAPYWLPMVCLKFRLCRVTHLWTSIL